MYIIFLKKKHTFMLKNKKNTHFGPPVLHSFQYYLQYYKAFMIVRKIRSKFDPIFLRKVKSADRDLDETLNWHPLVCDRSRSWKIILFWNPIGNCRNSIFSKQNLKSEKYQIRQKISHEFQDLSHKKTKSIGLLYIHISDFSAKGHWNQRLYKNALCTTSQCGYKSFENRCQAVPKKFRQSGWPFNYLY